MDCFVEMLCSMEAEHIKAIGSLLLYKHALAVAATQRS